jgi:hypothetical protein
MLTNERFAVFALILTSPTGTPSYRLRLFMFTASHIHDFGNDAAAVGCRRSRRVKVQAISMSVTAYSLALRRVNVTSAFEPRPRHDCERI